MNSRIKMVRKTLGLSQTEFGERLGIKQTTVAGYETGGRTPMDAVVSLICREFHVNENWLRTGEGEMFTAVTRKEEIAAFVGNVLSGTSEDFKVRFIAALAELNEDQWKLIEDMIEKLSGNKKE